jgi:hypothetical protein
MTAQTVLPHTDVPTGVLYRAFRAALDLLASRLVAGLGLAHGGGSGRDGGEGVGLTGPEKLGEWLEMYGGALGRVFIFIFLATGLAAVTGLGAAALEGKSVKKPGTEEREGVEGGEEV